MYNNVCILSRYHLTDLLECNITNTTESPVDDMSNALLIIRALLERMPSQTSGVVPLTTTIDMVWKVLKTTRTEESSLDKLVADTLARQELNFQQSIERMRNTNVNVKPKTIGYDKNTHQLQQPPNDFREMRTFPNLEVHMTDLFLYSG